MTRRERGQVMEPSVSSMILLMGVTGSGKSFFINRLREGAVDEEHGINSGTTECQLVTVKVNKETAVALIDTPGFDDHKRSDVEIFETIAEYLAVQYKLGIRLKGIIYLHRITDIKMPGSAIKYFNMFRELVGEKAMSNVVLATTMWSKLATEAEGLVREQLLREQYWSLMEAHGSHIETYDGSSDMAEEIVIQLASLENDVVLQLQEEMCVQHKRLDQTAAGGILIPDMDRALRDHDNELNRLDARLKEVVRTGDVKAQQALELQKLEVQNQRQRKATWRNRLMRNVDADAEEKIGKKKLIGMKEAISIFMAIIGITVNIIVAIV